VSAKNAITPDNVALAIVEALPRLFWCLERGGPHSSQDGPRGGKISALADECDLRDLPHEEKAAAGKLMGESKAAVMGALEARESELVTAREHDALAAEALDLSGLGEISSLGARHPLTMLMEDMADVFVSMGWEIAEGPELEHEWFNFDALNFDADHPARALQDTFFVEPVESHLLLRTHTSPVQIRSLLSRELPVYVVAPGRVYRTDELGRHPHPRLSPN